MASYQTLPGADAIALDASQTLSPPGSFDVAIRSGPGPWPPRWSEWFRLAGVPNAKPEFVAARFPNYELEAQAALQGIGAALLSPVLFAQFTGQGALTKGSSDAHFVSWMKSQFGGSLQLPES